MSVSIDAGSFHRGSPHRQPNHHHQLTNGGGPSPTHSLAPAPSSAALLQAQHQANQYQLYHSTGAVSLASSSSSASASLQQHLGLSAQAPTTFDAVADFSNSALDDEADEMGGKMIGEYSGLTRPDSKDGSQEGSQSTELAQSYYDPFRVKHRRRTSPPQLKVLEYHFEQNPKPDVALRKALSEQLDMTPREVQVWFQNRRAKTKKLREKQEKDASEAAPVAGDGHTTFSVPPRRNSTAEISHMASQSQASVIRPPPSNPTDFNSLRRGSSPAVLTAGLSGGQPSYEQYYEALSRQQFPLQPPNPNVRPQHYSSPPLHPPPFYASPLALSTPALSSASRSSLSPSDLSDYPPPHSQPFPGTNAGLPLDDPSQGGRRFSLPAFTSPSFGTPYAQHAWAQQKDGTTPTQQSFAAPSHPPSSVSSSYTPDPAGSFPPVPYGAPPPAEHHGVAGEMLNGYGGGMGRPGTRSGEGSSASPDDYSPGSSLDEQHLASQDYVGGGYPPHLYSGMNGGNGMSYESQSNLNQYTFGSMSHGSSYEDSITPLSTDSFNFGSNNSSATSPGGSAEIAGVTSPNGGRRSSCPAGFLPTFDNLGIASPTHPPPMWPPATAYQDPSALSASLATSPPLQPIPSTAGYPTSSMEAYLAGVPGQQQSLSTSLPSSAPPFPFATQQQFLQNSQRRGSTSSLLGTIAEQPGAVVGFNPDEMMDQNGSPGADRTARKVRSQASLRAPYPTQDRRSPNSLHERRGSAPGYDLGFLPPSTAADY